MSLPPLKWVQSPNFSTRSPKKIDLIVAHDTEGGYRGAISTFQNTHSEVSAHIVLREDGGEATQMVGYRSKAWHVRSFNSRAIGIEMAGFLAAGLVAAEWLAAAEITAYLCHRFGIPPTWTKDGVKPGVCRHYDLGKAGGGHRDPTQDLKIWQGFIDNVATFFKAAKWPTTPWGKD
jgi:N-acetyl-anhydromuramyl-L-alanine amidase AmpD